MATLDTLEPQSRAIVELLLRQGQGYDDIARMLDMPPARVRELAREALTELAPASARRVDGDWRDQVADYVLGQQTGPEIKATRGHLKRSEAARAWVSSLVDSLDPLYGDGTRPEIPEPGGRDDDRPRRRRGGGAALAAGGAAAGGLAGGAAATEVGGDQGAAPAGAGVGPVASEEAPAGEDTAVAPHDARDGGAAARDEPLGGHDDAASATETAGPGAAVAEPAEGAGAAAGTGAAAERGGGAAARGRQAAGTGPAAGTDRAGLSPEARAIVRRRRIIAGAIAAAILIAAIVVVILLLTSGGSSSRSGRPAGGAQGNAANAQARLVGQAVMQPQGGSKAQGVAVVAERAGQYQLLVQARGLQPTDKDTAYEVWLYNSPTDNSSLGGQVTDKSGNLQGAGPLPQDFRRWQFIDISREKLDGNPKHSGDSVLRVAIADILRNKPGAAGAGVPAGGGGAPAGGGAGGAQP